MDLARSRSQVQLCVRPPFPAAVGTGSSPPPCPAGAETQTREWTLCPLWRLWAPLAS